MNKFLLNPDSVAHPLDFIFVKIGGSYASSIMMHILR